MRFICVMGRRFSGSTILGRIFDASPDVFCIGETLSLLHGYACCPSCGGDCRIIDYNLLAKTPPERLYAELQRLSKKKVLVTTDKPFRYVSKMTKPLGFEAVFVFKSPHAFAASEKRGHPKHKKKDGSPVFKKVAVPEAMEGFCEYYKKALVWKRPARKTFVSLEHLVGDFHLTVGPLFELLGIRHPDSPYRNL